MTDLVKTDNEELVKLKNIVQNSLKLVDDIVLKNYISSLEELEIIPLDGDLKRDNIDRIRLFNITKMVYKKDEASTYKFASIFNAVASTNSSIVTIIDSDGKDTKFYLGIRNLMENSSSIPFEVLIKSIQGQFPGIQLERIYTPDAKKLLQNMNSDSVSSVSCIANNKNKDFIDNNKYLQGLEKLALAMQGERYSAIIIANPLSQNELTNVRKSYESIYTNIAPLSNLVLNYGKNSSMADTISKSQGITQGNSKSINTTVTENTSETVSHSKSESISKKSKKSVIGSLVGGALSTVGTVVGTTVGTAILPGAGTFAGAYIGSKIGGAIGEFVGKGVSLATDETVTSGETNSQSRTVGHSKSQGETLTKNESKTDTESFSRSDSRGESQGIQFTKQNKSIIAMLERIDNQLKRVNEFESLGMWECSAYFLSSSMNISTVAAATYKSLMTGENTGLEMSAINTWNSPSEKDNEKIERDFNKNVLVTDYVKNLMHPRFIYKNSFNVDIIVSPASLVSSNELAIHIGLPRNSVPGFPVVEHIDFGKEIVKYESKDKETDENKKIILGNIFNMGKILEKSEVNLDLESLSMHTFVSGATGSGKSNTIYHLLNKLMIENIKFMVIEPVKGEYKKVLGHVEGVKVFGTNPNLTELLHINPFRFPKEIHVLEHIDRLIEIFNVCWPMYAAMPAILKEAIIESYKKCGWNLDLSVNLENDNLFPTFIDLLEELKNIIKLSEYSEEVKSNYIGSLTTRVKSLTNGLNGQIFSSNEINNELLFDTNVIVDLSRVGSQETKSLLMGILVMRLSEYRMATSKTSNRKLHHVTVLEEAHNILRAKNSVSSIEGSNVTEKAVEMISNAIAEMRTYGEGFIIVDQSPSAVDISAIRNTNTKIIMRLPEENDRKMAGKSAALKEEQINEIARLPKGVAVVYQNDWIEAVLCQINKFDVEEKEYNFEQSNKIVDSQFYRNQLIYLMIQGRLDEKLSFDVEEIRASINKMGLSTRNKEFVKKLIIEYKQNGKISLWDIENFKVLSNRVTDILDVRKIVKEIVVSAYDTIELTSDLRKLVHRILPESSAEVTLTLIHCLMKDMSVQEDEVSIIREKIYRHWYDSVKKEEILL
ncbi:helicase HerA domain-containing protein [Fusobacterium pseudoperiodonticum]|jgi:hypothetical protein|uniref:ATP-binding protein n=1 Tax=Fusobacterium pseudoperiodonticum TaxID=2663009 RepID=UPI0028D36BB2|nr:DUF87 domain-containing protein [Fusobacterium pseudoperiodonticum]